MNTDPLTRVLAGVLALFAAGCASVSTEQTWEDVQGNVAERTGRRLQWNQRTEEDLAVNESVDDMLDNGLTTEEAVQVALINNPKLQATYEKLGIAQADLVQAGLLKNPVFEGTFRFIRHNGHSYDLGIAQDFLDVLLIPLRKTIARSHLEKTKLAVTAAVMDMVAKVRIAIVQAQRAKQVLAMRERVKEAAEASHEMARRLRRAGNITELEQSLKRERYEVSKLNQQSAEVDLLKSRERLNTLLGLWDAKTEWELADELPDIPEEKLDVANTQKRAVQNSLDLAMAMEDLRIAARSMGVEVAETISPELALGVEAEGEDGGEWEIGPTLALPIPVFDRGKAASASAEANIRRLWNRCTDLAVRLRSRSRTARYHLLAARQRALYYRDVVIPLREQIMEQTHERYNGMFLGVFQLLQAKKSEIDAKRRAIGEVANYWIARVELETLLEGRMLQEQPATAEASADLGSGMDGGGH